MTSRQQKLIDLFTEVATAHHQAFAETNGYDPEWPIWYADYLIDKLPPLLDAATFTRSELIYLLVQCDRQQMTESPGIKWPKYYAMFFMERYLIEEDEEL